MSRRRGARKKVGNQGDEVNVDILCTDMPKDMLKKATELAQKIYTTVTLEKDLATKMKIEFELLYPDGIKISDFILLFESFCVSYGRDITILMNV